MNVKPIVVEMTASEFVEFNLAMERNELHPLKEKVFEAGEGKTAKSYYCSVCDSYISNSDIFCCKCGSRIDHDNIVF